MAEPTHFPPIPIPADAGPATRLWFTRFNERVLERGLSLAANLPTVAELREEARRHERDGLGWLAGNCTRQADLIETDVRLLGLHALVGDYNTHPDRVVCRMYAHDYRKALLAQAGKLERAA